MPPGPTIWNLPGISAMVRSLCHVTITTTNAFEQFESLEGRSHVVAVPPVIAIAICIID